MTDPTADRPRVRLAPSLPVIAAFLVLAPHPALAYVGPGAGLTALGTVFALLAAFVLAVVGFVWYPLKRLLRRPAPQRRTAEPGRGTE